MDYNGKKDDNRIENLIVMKITRHKREHKKEWWGKNKGTEKMKQMKEKMSKKAKAQKRERDEKGRFIR